MKFIVLAILVLYSTSSFSINNKINLIYGKWITQSYFAPAEISAWSTEELDIVRKSTFTFNVDQLSFNDEILKCNNFKESSEKDWLDNDFSDIPVDKTNSFLKKCINDTHQKLILNKLNTYPLYKISGCSHNDKRIFDRIIIINDKTLITSSEDAWFCLKKIK